MNKKRKGKFLISKDLLESLDSEKLNLLFKDILIVRAEMIFHLDQVEYYAYSEHFDEVDLGFVVPEYQAVITRHDDDSISVEWEKC